MKKHFSITRKNLPSILKSSILSYTYRMACYRTKNQIIQNSRFSNSSKGRFRAQANIQCQSYSNHTTDGARSRRNLSRDGATIRTKI